MIKAKFICIFFQIMLAFSVVAQTSPEVDSLKRMLGFAHNDSNKVKLAFTISKLYWHTNPDSVKHYAEKGLEIARSVHFRKGEADCLNSLSAVFWMQRNYTMALDYTLQNLSIRHDIGDRIGIFNASNNLGLIYYETRKYDQALRYSNEALSIANTLNDQSKIAKASQNLGLIYFESGDTAKAYANYKKALEIQLIRKDTLELSYVYYNLGELFLGSKPSLAISYYQKALFLAEKIDTKELISASLQVLADEKRKAGELEESLALGKKALSMALAIKHLKVIDLSAQTLYKTYLQKKDYEKSLHYYIVAENARDSMLNEREIARMSEIKYDFDLKQKMKQIEVLERDKVIAQKSAQNQKLRFYLEIMAIILIGLVLFGVYRNLRIRQEKAERDKYERMLITAKEQAEESDRLKSAFLANMSHEIRTPMNAIIGFSECLTRPELSVQKRNSFSKIIKERSYDLLRIVEDILDISKIEIGQLKIVETELMLHKLMNDLFLEYQQKMLSDKSKASIQLKQSLTDDLKNKKIICDSQRIRQVITNLLDNAIKFTHEGDIEFGVKAENESLVFFVKDTGIGIPENKKEIVFDRFRQADEVLTARVYGGSGLGLAIVKGIVTLMNGKVWLESQEGHGSAFYFSIPLNVVK